MLAADRGTLAAAGRALLAWYEAERRDLPWRRRSDPYAIWVSEIMLQQTQVDTVRGYYTAFLERFPDLTALAAATEDEVVAAWSGLGYYRRARSLHRAALAIDESGRWPENAAEWRELPGIGEYTAAAISSIAGGEAVAVLDGNVERVISRWLASTGDPKRAAVRRPLLETATQLLVSGRAGDSNQAMMELGATVCLPRAPRCEVCPLAASCTGRATGDPERYPAARRRPATRRVRRRAFVVEDHGRLLLFRRSSQESQLAGFWELPWVGEGEGAAELARKYGGRWRLGSEHGTVAHAITNRRFEVAVAGASWESDGGVQEASGPAGWYSPAEIEELATSSLVAKALARYADSV